MLSQDNYNLTVFISLFGSNRPGSAFSSFHRMLSVPMSIKPNRKKKEEKKRENTQSG